MPATSSSSAPKRKRLPRWRRWLAVLVALGLLVWLAVAPDIPPEVLVERYGQPPSRFIRLPSGAVAHYRDQGNPTGPPLLLLHGWQASLHTWEPWVAELGDELRLISVDLPGHGLTGPVPSDDYRLEATVGFVTELLDGLHIGRCHVAGSSMGGLIAWQLAARRPDRVDHLILIDAAGYPTHGRLATGFGAAQLWLLRPVLRWVTPRWAVEHILREVFYHDERFVTEAMITRYDELIRRQGNRHANLRLLSVSYDVDTELQRLHTVTQPALILWGDRDPWLPVSDGESFHRDLPGSILRVYPEVGHLPMEEAARASAADARAFLRGELAAAPAEETAP